MQINIVDFPFFYNKSKACYFRCDMCIDSVTKCIITALLAGPIFIWKGHSVGDVTHAGSLDKTDHIALQSMFFQEQNKQRNRGCSVDKEIKQLAGSN